MPAANRPIELEHRPELELLLDELPLLVEYGIDDDCETVETASCNDICTPHMSGQVISDQAEMQHAPRPDR